MLCAGLVLLGAAMGGAWYTQGSCRSTACQVGSSPRLLRATAANPHCRPRHGVASTAMPPGCPGESQFTPGCPGATVSNSRFYYQMGPGLDVNLNNRPNYSSSQAEDTDLWIFLLHQKILSTCRKASQVPAPCPLFASPVAGPGPTSEETC